MWETSTLNTPETETWPETYWGCVTLLISAVNKETISDKLNCPQACKSFLTQRSHFQLRKKQGHQRGKGPVTFLPPPKDTKQAVKIPKEDRGGGGRNSLEIKHSLWITTQRTNVKFWVVWRQESKACIYFCENEKVKRTFSWTSKPENHHLKRGWWSVVLGHTVTQSHPLLLRGFEVFYFGGSVDPSFGPGWNYYALYNKGSIIIKSLLL